MTKKHRKSISFLTGIIAMIGAYLFVIIIVLIFFYFFKFHVTVVIQEQYLWNKLQEVPMSLLSMSLDDESFVSRMNRVFYGFDEEEWLRDRIDDIILKQVFYLYGEITEYPLTFVISINGIQITEHLVGCHVYGKDVGPLLDECYCSDECGTNAGKYLGDHLNCEWAYSVDLCLYTTGTRVEYSAEFPFPLAFNGTDNFIGVISYEVIETK